MSAGLQLRHERHQHVDVLAASGALLWRYVYSPQTAPNESPRPFAHPVNSPAGDLLTNFRPHDHPWHHALSLTLTSVDGVNFWGGPTYAAEGGYQWREDHGAQVHRAWVSLEPDRLEHTLDWCDPRTGRVLLHEQRVLRTETRDAEWTLRWESSLLNVTGHDLALGNYESPAGLRGSHYTGLQFRGARDLLDDYGDSSIGVAAEGLGDGEEKVHGGVAPVMEWRCRHDGSLRRTLIRFEGDGTVKWFVRRKNPLAAFSFNRGEVFKLPAGGTLPLHHTLRFSSR